MPEPLSIERAQDGWTVKLNRPERANALSVELVEALIEAVAEARTAGVALLVFRGAGRNLSAGFDLSNLEHETDGGLLHRFVRIETLLQDIARAPCLTLAFAHGNNFGAGADLFAACRWRIADESASFQMPGLAFGLVLGSRRFAAIVGSDRAREVLESLRALSAREACAMGLVRRIEPQTDWAATVAEASAVAARLTNEMRSELHAALDGRSDAEDLARLVRSAARPGLKERMQQYVAQRLRHHAPQLS